MYQKFDEAVMIGTETYRSLGYSPHSRCGFTKACAELKAHLERGGDPYSLERAKVWLHENEHTWDRNTQNIKRRSLKVLADIMVHGRVTDSLKTKAQRRPCSQVPSWGRAVLNEYLESLAQRQLSSKPESAKIYCSKFFCFLNSRGISTPGGITCQAVIEFADLAGSGIGRYRSQAVFEVDHMLIYMAGKGMVTKAVGYILNKYICGDYIALDKLHANERGQFSRFVDPDDDERERSRKAFDDAADILYETHKCRGYAPNILYIDSQAARTFSVFMDANHFGYSEELAAAWLAYNKTRWDNGKYTSIRRSLLCIGEIIKTGKSTSQRFIAKMPKFLVPDWGKALVEEYRAYRTREGCAPSTLSMIRDACGRLLVFLESRGVGGPEDIKPEHLKEFHEADSHKTVEGKNGYAIKIRGFLRWLAGKGLVPASLELAVVTDMAPRTAVVSILGQDQSDAIYAFRSEAENPFGLRNAAIIMLGLRMGLRASDIAGLKRRDISWQCQRISIVQQKTGIFLELPMPTDVGNSIYKYLMTGRPQSDDPHVFIRHTAPYCGMCGTHFDAILNSAVQTHSFAQTEPTHGFHITRRTFASGMLKAGNNVNIISAALGHVGNKGVDPYLSTDGDRMKLCAIGLKGIEYAGGFGL